MSIVLSLFPGIGLLDHAFEQEEFCVMRGPDVLWGGDVRRFHPPADVFDGIIGGPPCQSFSSLVHLVRANGHEPKFGNLIPEFERCILEAQPRWFLMENVPQAPEPVVSGYGVKSFLLDNSALDDGSGMGLEQRRVRRFCFGMLGVAEPPLLLRWIDLAVFLLPDLHEAPVGHGQPPWTREAKGCVRPITASTGFPHDEEFKKRVPPVTAGHEQPAGLTERKRRLRQPAVTSTDGGERPSEKKRVNTVSGSNGGAGSDRITPGAGNNGRGRYKLADACRLQGLPEDFLADAPFTAEGKLKAVANGVPLPMGRALAKAVKEALLLAVL